MKQLLSHLTNIPLTIGYIIGGLLIISIILFAVATIKSDDYYRDKNPSIICNQNKSMSWKSKLHADGTMFDDFFIVGIDTPEGQFTYHYHIDNWDLFDVLELPNAPEYDGHTPGDVTRLHSLIK